MPTETFHFDIAEHLKTDEDIREFLKEIITTGDTSDFIHALSIVVIVRLRALHLNTP